MKKASIFLFALVMVMIFTLIAPMAAYAETPYVTYTIDGYGWIRQTQTAYLAYETITKFGLGYSDKGGRELYRYLKSKDFDDDILKESGLFTFDENYLSNSLDILQTSSGIERPISMQTCFNVKAEISSPTITAVGISSEEKSFSICMNCNF